MFQDSHKWVTVGMIFLLSSRSEHVFSHSFNPHDKIFGEIKRSELANVIGSTGFSKFQYPKEETTHGVGYGHHLHPFYFQGNELFYSCALQGDWLPIVHSNVISNYDSDNSVSHSGNSYSNSYMYGVDRTSNENVNERSPQGNQLHFLQAIPHIINLKRTNLFHRSFDSSPEGSSNQEYKSKYTEQEIVGTEIPPHHRYTDKQAIQQTHHIKPPSSNETTTASTPKKELITYLVPPPKPSTPMSDVNIQLQQFLPNKRHYTPREKIQISEHINYSASYTTSR